MYSAKDNFSAELAELFRRLNSRSSRNDMDCLVGRGFLLKLIEGNEGECLRFFADTAQISIPTAAEQLVRLEKLGFLEKKRNDSDKRKIGYFLTESGRAKVSSMKSSLEESIDRALLNVPDSEILSAVSLIKRINTCLSGDDSPTDITPEPVIRTHQPSRGT
ncbi:MAG: winged helix-turn-helix transcriptional regulator, partial [Oscillospiraceae bacterium]|nr:winged helix-turn-helix transcriptional regulator [Oscillospiraceae bacterium]